MSYRKKILWLLPFFTLLTPVTVKAEIATLGVVKSQENSAYWGEITRRLQRVRVAYCVLDVAQMQRGTDLSGTKLLFFPNVESLTGEQVQALQTWMSQGGRAIASGPTGSLSEPEVRERLRSLLGAYWGFSLNQPTTLNSTEPQLSGRIRGGVIIPTGINATTIAVWNSERNPPAVVTNEQTTFLGWRWGMDTVSSTELDVAWLRNAIARYQPITPTTPSSPPPDCIPSRIATTPTPSDPAEAVAPAKIDPTTPANVLTPERITAMRQELQNLIDRFESALLTANALNNKPIPTSAAIQQFLTPNRKQDTTPTPPTNRIIATARENLQNFQQLATEQNYTAATQQWLNARRLLWDNYPTTSRLATAEVRAVWLDRGTIVKAGSEENLAKIFDQLLASGINTVFFETVNAGYPIYPSRIAPQQNPLIQGWDPLEAAVKLAHERGMELHAWVWCFAAGNSRHNLLLNQPSSYPGPLIAAHPTWANYDNRGQMVPLGQTKPFLDPANPEVRRYLLQVIEEIASRYQVDGIHLDYIRYPFQDVGANQLYGYGVAARQQFQELTGVDPRRISPRQNELWQRWTDFRSQQIDSFVATVSQRLHSLRPNLILSAAVFPLPPSERRERLQQNWEGWIQRGEIDLLVPMTYAVDTNGLQQLATPLLNQSGSTLIAPGIRLLNLPDRVAIDQIQLLRDLPTSGYALFAFENFDRQLQDIFNRTQGTARRSLTEPIPYRQPFGAAAARFTALQQEWNYLLIDRQILLSGEALVEWGKQTDALAIAFNQLATTPTPEHLATAKTLLSTFRNQFPKWMQPQAVQSPYQVQVWSDRLTTISGLLRYGESPQN